MKIYFGFLLLLLHPLLMQSQPVKISGTAPGAEGKIIHVYEISDRITMMEKEIAKTRIDSVARFVLNADIKSTGSIILSIDFHETEIFAEPGKIYEIAIAPLNYNSTIEINPFIESQNLEVEFLQKDPRELNQLIRGFNSMYNVFLLKNFNDLYREHNIAKLDTFHKQMLRDFPDTANAYFAGYLRYKFASLEEVAKAKSPIQLQKTYFTSKPILYRNVEYMDFFNLFFIKYMTAVSRQLKFIDYPSILNKAESYPNLIKAMKADTNLKRMDLRELVMLYGLKEMYFSPGFDQPSILSLLGAVAKTSLYEEHRLIASDMILQLTKLNKGSSAPPFTLQDRNKKMVSLADFKGKPVMISFWTVYCQDCLARMELLKPVADKYKGKVEFISISADKEFVKMSFFLNLKKSFTWNFLHIGESIDLLKDYNVKSYPLFVLIDKQGKIFRYPASFPGEGLEEEIEGMLNP